MYAVILAGGKGKRLAPYTTVLPKPLMPIGDMPILEVVLRQLRYAGIRDVTIAVGHLAELLQAFFKDGDKFGLNIDYSIEDKPLGTVGPIACMDHLDDTFLMMNGDILTNISYQDIVTYHRENRSVATIATYSRKVSIDFGIIKTNGENFLSDYIEKPSLEYNVSMGIYVFEPHIRKYLRKGEYFDFPQLVKLLIQSGERVLSYPFNGYWLDIGRPDDYSLAIEEFDSRKSEFLKEG